MAVARKAQRVKAVMMGDLSPEIARKKESALAVVHTVKSNP